MNHYIQAAKSYLLAHKKDISTAAPIVICLAFLIGIVVYATVRNMPNIVYQPVKACDLLTPAKAQDLLGDHVFNVDSKLPVIAGDNATSKCGFSDANEDANQMAVAAVAIRSGINDKGDAKNKADFRVKKAGANTQVVNDLGDSAYYDLKLGQLNVLDGHNWFIFSNGPGNAPEANTLEKSLELAHKIIK